MKYADALAMSSRADQYLGPILMEPGRLEAFIRMVDQIDPVAHRRVLKARMDMGWRIGQPLAEIGEDGVAVLHLDGVLTKCGSSLSEAGSMVNMKRLVRQWAADDGVKGMLLRIDSPGGTVAGTVDLADEIAAFRALKPTVAYIEDLGASAAYWLASQCGQVFANRTAQVGSIGCYQVVVDESRRAEKAGVVVHVLRSAEHKGAGVPGAEITDDQLAAIQEYPDQIHTLFVAAVAGGRGMNPDDVAAFATGRCYLADEALSLGMIDDVCTLDEARQRVLGGTAAAVSTDPQTRSGGPMAVAPKKPAAAAPKTNRPKAEAAPAKAAPAKPAPAAPAAEEEEQPAAADPVDEETTDEAQPADAPTPEDETDDEAEVEAAPAPAKSAKVASMAELKAAFPKSTAEFREKCNTAGMSLGQARAAYTKVLQDRVDQLEGKGRAGVPPLGSKGGSAAGFAGDAAAEVSRRVAELQTKGYSVDRARAHVFAQDPGLREAWVAEHNAKAQAAKGRSR